VPSLFFAKPKENKAGKVIFAKNYTHKVA